MFHIQALTKIALQPTYLTTCWARERKDAWWSWWSHTHILLASWSGGIACPLRKQVFHRNRDVAVFLLPRNGTLPLCINDHLEDTKPFWINQRYCARWRTVCAICLLILRLNHCDLGILGQHLIQELLGFWLNCHRNLFVILSIYPNLGALRKHQ